MNFKDKIQNTVQDKKITMTKIQFQSFANSVFNLIEESKLIKTYIIHNKHINTYEKFI